MCLCLKHARTGHRAVRDDFSYSINIPLRSIELKIRTKILRTFNRYSKLSANCYFSRRYPRSYLLSRINVTT